MAVDKYLTPEEMEAYNALPDEGPKSTDPNAALSKRDVKRRLRNNLKRARKAGLR